MNPKILPTLMIVIVIGLLAAVGYFFAGDYRRTIYWVSASVLTASVTY